MTGWGVLLSRCSLVGLQLGGQSLYLLAQSVNALLHMIGGVYIETGKAPLMVASP